MAVRTSHFADLLVGFLYYIESRFRLRNFSFFFYGVFSSCSFTMNKKEETSRFARGFSIFRFFKVVSEYL